MFSSELIVHNQRASQYRHIFVAISVIVFGHVADVAVLSVCYNPITIHRPEG